MIASKFLTALLQFAVLAVGAFVAIPENGWTLVVIFQFLALIIGAIVTLLVPLAPGRWPALLKTGFTVLLGVIAALLPLLVDGQFNYRTGIPILVLAALNVLSSELGVQVRVASEARHAKDSPPPVPSGFTAIPPIL